MVLGLSPSPAPWQKAEGSLSSWYRLRHPWGGGGRPRQQGGVWCRGNKGKISCHIQAFPATSSPNCSPPVRRVADLNCRSDPVVSPIKILQWFHGEIPMPRAPAPARPTLPHLSSHTELTALRLPQPTLVHRAPLPSTPRPSSSAG